MSAFGTPGIQPAAGVRQIARTDRYRPGQRRSGNGRDGVPGEPSSIRDGDTLDLEVTNTETDDLVRGTAANAREEAAEDRQKQGSPAGPAARPPLDLSA